MHHGPGRDAREDAGAAAARLFADHSEEILGYCLRQLKARSEAEDAVQTTFLYAFRALRRGVVPECEPAWLTAIAKNVCRSQRRTLDRRGALASDVDVDRVGLARPDGDEDEELLAGLKSALASLPESQRRALVLREWQGLPSREIATLLGVTPTATYALLTRARRSLALALTAQRRVLGLELGTLVYQLRTLLKTLFGGAGAKAATATVVVTSVAIGSVTAERALSVERTTPRAPFVTVPRLAVEEAVPGVASTEKRKPEASRKPQSRRRVVASNGVQPAVGGQQVPNQVERAILPPAGAPAADFVPGSVDDPPASPRPESERVATLPVELASIPDVELPTDLSAPDLPPVVPPVPPLPSGDTSIPPAPDLGVPLLP